jgi:hypothetical protein
MGKLTLVVEDAPAKVGKNEEVYKEVAQLFDTIAIGKSIPVSNSEVPSLGLIAKIRSLINLKEGEDIRISRTYGDDKKLSGVRLIKTIFKPKKVKAEPQGEAEEA